MTWDVEREWNPSAISETQCTKWEKNVMACSGIFSVLLLHWNQFWESIGCAHMIRSIVIYIRLAWATHSRRRAHNTQHFVEAVTVAIVDVVVVDVDSVVLRLYKHLLIPFDDFLHEIPILSFSLSFFQFCFTSKTIVDVVSNINSSNTPDNAWCLTHQTAHRHTNAVRAH